MVNVLVPRLRVGCLGTSVLNASFPSMVMAFALRMHAYRFDSSSMLDRLMEYRILSGILLSAKLTPNSRMNCLMEAGLNPRFFKLWMLHVLGSSHPSSSPRCIFLLAVLLLNVPDSRLSNP